MTQDKEIFALMGLMLLIFIVPPPTSILVVFGLAVALVFISVFLRFRRGTWHSGALDVFIVGLAVFVMFLGMMLAYHGGKTAGREEYSPTPPGLDTHPTTVPPHQKDSPGTQCNERPGTTSPFCDVPGG